MPFKSQAQRGYFYMAASPAGRAALKKHGKKVPPMKAVKKMIAHDKAAKK